MADDANPANGIDTSVPNAARVYDYWLGGKDNFAVDRQVADATTQALPQMPWLARQNREFLGRAVRFCAEAGITQFLDIGSGLPTMENVHQVARRAAQDPHVVYADIDPVVVTHAQALITTPHTAGIRGDVTKPDEIISSPEVGRLIDFTQPLAILVVAVLHFVYDEDDPFGCIAKLRDAMAPGSYLVISHTAFSPSHFIRTDPQSDAGRELLNATKGLPAAPARTADEVAKFFGGLTLVDPGLTEVWEWRPDTVVVAPPVEVMTLLGGVGRKD